MVHTRKFSGGSPSTPQTQRIAAAQSGDIVIANGSWSTLVTLAEFFVRHSPVLLIATIGIDLTANPGTLQFQVTRDGTSLGVYDEEFDNAEPAKVKTLHWFDPTPGDSPVYVLQAQANAADIESRDSTLFSAHM